jgi:hypothetical protein
MNVNYISSKAVIYQWMAETGRSTGFNEEILATQILDALSIMEYKSALKHSITLLKVKNHKAKLPKGLVKIDIVMYNHSPQRVGSLFIKEAIIPSFDGQCDYKITGEYVGTDCEDCGVVLSHKPLIESLIYPFSSKFRAQENISSVFKPMKYAMHSLEMKRYHLKECAADADSFAEYSVKSGFIHTNFPEGDILLSYYSQNLDDEGYLMVPDDSRIITALTAYLEQQAAYKEYIQKKDQASRIYYTDMKQNWNMKLSSARSSYLLSEIDMQELSKILVNLYKFEHAEHFWKDYTKRYA